MKYRVTGRIPTPEVALALVDAGLVVEYAPGYLAGVLEAGDVLRIDSKQAGRVMPEWLVPLYRDLGVVDIEVQRKAETEWEAA